MPAWGGYLVVFGARVIDVSLSTVRTLMLVRGRKFEAAAIGFFEVSVYIVALGLVVSDLQDPLKLVVYALGFATGNLVGSLVEERLALGYLTVEAIVKEPEGFTLAEALRDGGFGVTTVVGRGREGPSHVLFVSVRRRSLRRLLSLLKKHSPQAFVTVLETRGVRGGVFDFRQRK
ncbi:MAG: DUF5698 domain-containing protein [Acetobacteraceae bacterium]|nr:DUF5698 domain-containing protein [Acetobacteraceae bacterium]